LKKSIFEVFGRRRVYDGQLPILSQDQQDPGDLGPML